MSRQEIVLPLRPLTPADVDTFFAAIRDNPRTAVDLGGLIGNVEAYSSGQPEIYRALTDRVVATVLAATEMFAQTVGRARDGLDATHIAITRTSRGPAQLEIPREAFVSTFRDIIGSMHRRPDFLRMLFTNVLFASYFCVICDRSDQHVPSLTPDEGWGTRRCTSWLGLRPEIESDRPFGMPTLAAVCTRCHWRCVMCQESLPLPPPREELATLIRDKTCTSCNRASLVRVEAPKPSRVDLRKFRTGFALPQEIER